MNLVSQGFKISDAGFTRKVRVASCNRASALPISVSTWLSARKSSFHSSKKLTRVGDARYALLGLFNARQAGFTVDDKVMEWAEKFLMHYLDEPTDVRAASTFNERAFVIFVLAEMDRPMTSRAVSLFDQRADASQYGTAFLLMALQHLHQPQADTLKTELTSAAILTASGAHWEESFRDATIVL